MRRVPANAEETLSARAAIAAEAPSGRATRVRRRSARTTAFAFGILLAVLAGCSTFERDWKRATAQPTSGDSIEGAWVGRWSSDATGHSGPLRCLVWREDASHYAAHFRAGYAGVFRFTYTVRLEAQPHYGGWEFSGQEDLGALAGGVYYYEGHATPTNFFSTYRSKRDHGIFEMRRPD